MHGAAYGSFPSVLQLLADNGADPELWSRPNRHGWTPLFIAEGYRPGNFKPAPLMIAAVETLMARHGLSTDGARPRHIGRMKRLASRPRSHGSCESLPDPQALGTHCRMWLATATSAPSWFVTSMLETERRRFRSTAAIS